MLASRARLRFTSWGLSGGSAEGFVNRTPIERESNHNIWYSPTPNPEARNYIFFLLVYDALVGSIWAVGPFRARTVALYAAERAEQTGYLFGRLLANLGPARLTGIKGSGLGGFTAAR